MIWEFFKKKKNKAEDVKPSIPVESNENEGDKFSAAAAAQEENEGKAAGRKYGKMFRQKTKGDRLLEALLPGFEKFHQQQVWVARVFFVVLVGFIVFPLFIMIHRLIPNPELKFPIDRILIFLALEVGVFYLFRKIKYLIWTILIIGLLPLSITSLAKVYSFNDLGWDYRGFVYLLADESHTLQEAVAERPFPRYRNFLKAAQFTPEVRQYALKAAQANFQDEQSGTMGQYVKYFSIFKEINSKWKYVSDPQKLDYVAPANESIETFCGDCDDYAVLMAAAINSIGGTVRLVRTETHVYPELKIEEPEDFTVVKKLIRKKLFVKEIKGKEINYHEDGQGNIWLNLDYTGPYPGSAFLADDIVSVLVIR